jgi:hypothetical protein
VIHIGRGECVAGGKRYPLTVAAAMSSSGCLASAAPNISGVAVRQCNERRPARFVKPFRRPGVACSAKSTAHWLRNVRKRTSLSTEDELSLAAKAKDVVDKYLGVW